MKRILALILILALLPLSGCETKPQRYQYQFFDTFDTVVTLTLYAANERQADKWSERAHDRFLELHRLFDRFHEYEGMNNVATLNARAGSEAVEVPQELWELLDLGKLTYAKRTVYDGRQLNIAFGAVTDIWHGYIEAASASGGTENGVPEQSVLEEAAQHTDPADIRIHYADNTVSFNDPLLKLDLGAVAKGYAAGQAADTLREAGCSSFLISAGGNIVAGDPPAGAGREYWNVGLQNPDAATNDTASLLGVAALKNTSMVTSGDYQRYYIAADGARIHHIIDPDTLRPAAYYRSLTIITWDSRQADALSTALFCMDYEESRAAAEQWQVGAIWVFPDGRIIANERAEAVFEQSAAEQN